MNENVMIIVVTYNRINSLKKWIESVSLIDASLYTQIVIIDNASTDGTDKYCNKIEEKNQKYKYIRNAENIGGSGGFYIGIKYAYEHGADLIWGMDDDAYPEADSLEKILSFANNDNYNNCYWSNANADKDFSGESKEVHHLMFVGFLITRQIIKEVGLPRKDFFIYLDDIEYSYRIKKNGFKIIKVKDSVISHVAAGEKKYPPKKILSYKVEFSDTPDWKYYYWIRNYCLMYPWTDINKYITLTVKMAKILFKTALFNKKQIRIFFRAYKDGILGRSGKRIEPGWSLDK